MKLLIDTDASCKLGVAGLLPDVINRIFGAGLSECGRLPALPHMLNKRVLRERYGGDVCDELIPVARSMPVLPDASIVWLEELTPWRSVWCDQPKNDFGKLGVRDRGGDCRGLSHDLNSNREIGRKNSNATFRVFMRACGAKTIIHER